MGHESIIHQQRSKVSCKLRDDFVLLDSATSNRGCHRDGVCGGVAATAAAGGRRRTLRADKADSQVVCNFGSRNEDCRSNRLKVEKAG